MNKVRILEEVMRFFFKASTIYDIHSPLAYDICHSVMHPDRIAELVRKVEEIKFDLVREDPVIEGEDLGSQGVALQNSVVSFVKYASCPQKRGRILHSLVSHFQPTNVLELGTGLGFSSVYLAEALPQGGNIISIEGHRGRADFAKAIHRDLDITCIQVRNTDIRQALGRLHEQEKSFDLFYVDGDHDGGRLSEYLSMIQSISTERAIIVLDDIRWSKSMLDAWQGVYIGNQYGLALDFFNMGILVKDQISMVPLRAKVIPYWLKPWRAGFFTSS